MNEEDPQGRRLDETEVARIGWARPPLVFLVSIGLGVALHVLTQWRLGTGRGGAALGALAIVMAGALFLLAVRELRRVGTPVSATRSTSAIVCRGPYRWTRNPIYLSFTILQVGLALLLASLWLLLTLLPAMALVALIVVPREERYLETRFPKEYPAYKTSTRRWL